MSEYVLALDVTESDGVCTECPNGPHMHVLPRDAVQGELAVSALLDSKVVRRHFDLAVARAVAAELARRDAEENDE